MFPILFFQCFHLFFPMLCQGEGRDVLPPLTPVLTSWLPKCPPHPTSQQTIGSPQLTRRHSHLWGLTPSKPFLIREISPQLHVHVTHLFTGLDVFELPICFYLSCLCWKWAEFVSIYWMTAQKLAQWSPFSSKWCRFLSSNYHIR